MKFDPSLQPVTIIALALFFSFISTHSALASESGWVLTQRTKLFGDQYLYLSNHAVKCVNPKQGIGWITQSPNWNITFFNDKTKVYYPLASTSWKNKMAKNGLIPSDISWSKVSSGSIAGLKASQYQMINKATGQSNQPANGAKWSSATYWLADEINVPRNLSQLISTICGLPPSDSVPLSLSYSNQRGQTETLLSTYHQQTAMLPDWYFSTPTNYKLAKSEVEVLMSQQNRAFINELANDLTHDNKDNRGQSSANQLSINKLPDQLTLPGGKTVSKDQINKFLNKLKQNQQ